MSKTNFPLFFKSLHTHRSNPLLIQTQIHWLWVTQTHALIHNTLLIHSPSRLVIGYTSIHTLMLNPLLIGSSRLVTEYTNPHTLHNPLLIRSPSRLIVLYTDTHSHTEKPTCSLRVVDYTNIHALRPNPLRVQVNYLKVTQTHIHTLMLSLLLLQTPSKLIIDCKPNPLLIR